MARLPKPIPKPRIEVSTDTTGLKKAWREISADKIRVGDIVQGHNRGLVTDFKFGDDRAINAHGPTIVILTFKNGTMERIPRSDLVTAFTVTYGNG